MVILRANNIFVQIRDEQEYNSKSNDNHIKYNRVIDHSGGFNPSSQYSVRSFNDEELTEELIILGKQGATTVHQNSALIFSDQILICCGNEVFCFSLPRLELLWNCEADYATCFGIHKIGEVIIVHGELQMSRIDLAGNILWTCGGADIFVDHNGISSLKFHDNFFEIDDFSENHYVISYGGTLLSNVRSRWYATNNNLPFIRETDHSDIKRMHEIRMTVKENTLSNPNLITPADYEEFLFRRGKGWVAIENLNIIGFAICDLKEENIWALFVHPDHEGKGVARALQKEMLEWYFTQKEKVWLGTAPGTRAEKFYRASGWREKGMHGKEVKFEMTKEMWHRFN